jgi:hypothetical protein
MMCFLKRRQKPDPLLEDFLSKATDHIGIGLPGSLGPALEAGQRLRERRDAIRGEEPTPTKS